VGKDSDNNDTKTTKKRKKTSKQVIRPRHDIDDDTASMAIPPLEPSPTSTTSVLLSPSPLSSSGMTTTWRPPSSTSSSSTPVATRPSSSSHDGMPSMSDRIRLRLFTETDMATLPNDIKQLLLSARFHYASGDDSRLHLTCYIIEPHTVDNDYSNGILVYSPLAPGLWLNYGGIQGNQSRWYTCLYAHQSRPITDLTEILQHITSGACVNQQLHQHQRKRHAAAEAEADRELRAARQRAEMALAHTNLAMMKRPLANDTFSNLSPTATAATPSDMAVIAATAAARVIAAGAHPTPSARLSALSKGIHSYQSRSRLHDTNGSSNNGMPTTTTASGPPAVIVIDD
jgi:hypothetical protein